MSRKTKTQIFKLVLLLIFMVMMIGITIYLIPVMKDISTKEGQAIFKERVNKSGIIGFLMLFGLQVAQVFLFIIPGEPIEILAGICYGGFLRNHFYIDFNSNYNNFYIFFSTCFRTKIYI